MKTQDFKKVYKAVEAAQKVIVTIHQLIEYSQEYNYDEDILWQWRAKISFWLQNNDPNKDQEPF